MDSRELPTNITQHMSVQQVGSETLIYDETRHRAFCLNQTSSIVWRLADGRRSIAEIASAASFELDSPISDDLVLFAVEELRREGLIQTSALPNAKPEISRRSLLRTLGVGGAMLLPVIAAIVAPTAAQAYSGCIDCSAVPASQRTRRQPLRTAPK